MNVSVDGAFIYFTIPVLGGINITQTTVSSFVVSVLLIIACIYFGKNLKVRPDGKQVLVEKGVSLIYELTTSTMGAHNVRWAPLMGTIFLSSVCGSLIGLTGFLRSSPADLSCTLTWALMVSVIIWYNNIIVIIIVFIIIKNTFYYILIISKIMIKPIINISIYI